jgi:hypothetical protein
MALYDVLESHGLEVNVANARHTKTLPGRKPDVQECQWLQKLHTFGLLNNSLRPTEEERGHVFCLRPVGSSILIWSCEG